MPRVTINIAEPEGQALVGSTWRYATGYVPGAENGGLVFEQTGGSPARLPDYDDSGWEICTDLPGRVSGGFGFAWYRTTITIPETVDGHPTSGMRVQFETCVDDHGRSGGRRVQPGTRDRAGVQRVAAGTCHRGCPAGESAHHRGPGDQRAHRRPVRDGVRAVCAVGVRVLERDESTGGE